jgi:hypothetical protein
MQTSQLKLLSWAKGLQLQMIFFWKTKLWAKNWFAFAINP